MTVMLSVSEAKVSFINSSSNTHSTSFLATNKFRNTDQKPSSEWDMQTGQPQYKIVIIPNDAYIKSFQKIIFLLKWPNCSNSAQCIVYQNADVET
jgi:hypothetical protein